VRESSIESILTERVKREGGWAIKLAGSISGLPDRMILYPGGRITFVELKAPGKKPRPLQISMHNKLQRLGFNVHVIDNAKDAREKELT